MMKKMDWRKLLEQYRLQIGLGIAGLILFGLGWFLFKSSPTESPKIEIISEESKPATIWVDLEGAIQNPGVYELPNSARLNDLLIKAGGLSAEADRNWVAKNLNLAQKLEDAQKIYIPSQQEVTSFGGPALSTAGSVAGVADKININNASANQLDSLYGIGEKRASDIIANRPYQSIEELVSRKIIPQTIYDRIKEQIAAY